MLVTLVLSIDIFCTTNEMPWNNIAVRRVSVLIRFCEMLTGHQNKKKARLDCHFPLEKFFFSPQGNKLI